MSDSSEVLADAVAKVRSAIGARQPDVGLILGSGLGMIAEMAVDRVVIPYGDITGFNVSDVEGHAGQLVIGDIGTNTVMIMQGRFHYYEGLSMEEIAFPIKLMQEFGVGSVIITSASGGVNPEFQKGDIMVLDDHINFVFRNPFRRIKSAINVKNIGDDNQAKNLAHAMSNDHMPGINEVYDHDLKQLAFDVAKTANIEIKRGVYLMLQGPCYETKAEIKMVRKLGGDVVGMSTVPEALAASHYGMSVLGITYVSNMASGLAPGPLVHSHVIETMDIIKEDMLKLILGIIKGIKNATNSKDQN